MITLLSFGAKNPAEMFHLHKRGLWTQTGLTTPWEEVRPFAACRPPAAPPGRAHTSGSDSILPVSSQEEDQIGLRPEICADSPLDLPPSKPPFEQDLHMQNEWRLRAIMVFVLLLMCDPEICS